MSPREGAVKVIDRYLFREMVTPTLAALALLFQLLIALQLLRRVDVLLGSAVRARDLLAILRDLTPHYLVLALPIAVLLGVLIGLGQLAEAGELDALSAAGIAPLRLLGPPAVLAALAGLVVLGLTLGPESAGLVRVRQRFNEILKLSVQHDVKPGVFYDEVSGLTLFAEGIDPATGDWKHVLLNDERDRRAPLLLLADTGHVTAGGPEEALTLRLVHGQGHRQAVTEGDYQALSFAKGAVSISVEDSLLRKNTLRSYDDEKSLPQLWRDSPGPPVTPEALQSRVALHRRLGLVLSILALVWLGVPLALRPGSAAGARARGYLLAALAVVGYFVLLRVGTTLGLNRQVPPWVSGQVANGCFMLAGAVAWLRLQVRG